MNDGHDNYRENDSEELTYCEHDLRNAKRNHNPPSTARSQPTHVSTLSGGGYLLYRTSTIVFYT